MKKLFYLLVFVAPILLAAQEAKFRGGWVGIITVNQIPLDIRFNIQPKYDGWVSTLDVPVQNLRKFKLNSTKINHNEVRIESEDLKLVFTGKRTDSNTIKGTMVQRGKTTPIVLKRWWTQWPVPKPQTPQPPFSYINREVKISTAAGRIMVAGTLSLPDTLTLHPTIIMISGSGAQDRDGSIGNHHPFALLADAFVKQGFAVLRCDDRGAGKTMGSPTTIAATTTLNQAEDVSLFYEFLKHENGIDTNRIGLLGHSEGGVIAPMVASRFQPHVAFLVLLAAPSFGGFEINSFQNETGLKAAGMKGKNLKSYMKLHRELLHGIIDSKDTTAFKPVFDSILNHWKKSESTAILRNKITKNDKNKRELWNRYTTFFMPWWKYFLAYDPQTDLSKITCPVLALNGSRDNQVPVNPNLGILKKTIESNGNKNVKTLELAGMNHLFQTCKTCKLNEYFTLDETFSVIAMGEITNWLKSTVKP